MGDSSPSFCHKSPAKKEEKVGLDSQAVQGKEAALMLCSVFTSSIRQFE